MQRRNFLKGLGATFALSSIPGAQAFAFNPLLATAKQDEILVFVFMKGGCDGLHLLAPISDPSYTDARSQKLRIDEAEALSIGRGLSGLDFALHPKATALHELYKSKDLALVHATGLSHGTRSHFEASMLLELGSSSPGAIKTGWLTRFLETLQPQGALPAVTVGSKGMSATLLGSEQAMAIDAIKNMEVKGEDFVTDILSTFYQGDALLHRQARKALSDVNIIKEGATDESVHHHDAVYPTNWYIKSFSQQLQELATLIRMDIGIQVAVVELDGWDHHSRQEQSFPQLLGGFSQALSAFYNDLHQYHNQLTIVAMSEFGRRLRSNRSGGTDHGHGGVSLILGGKVKGGRMYGDWPGLETHQLDRSVDLQVTTDYRVILKEILARNFKADRLDYIFPDLAAGSHLGFL